MTATTHTVRAKLAYPIGPVDSIDEELVESDIVFGFNRTVHAVELKIFLATPVEERKGEPWNREILRDAAEDWLYGDGYEKAVALAKKERGEE